MKRLLALTLAVILACASAALADFDISGMTDEELVELRDAIDHELLVRAFPEPGEVLYESEYVRLVFLSSETYETRGGGIRTDLRLEWTNLSRFENCFSYFFDVDAYVDGVHWMIYIDDRYVRILPGVTYEITLPIIANRDSEQVEIRIRAIGARDPFRTFTIFLR